MQKRSCQATVAHLGKGQTRVGPENLVLHWTPQPLMGRAF